MRVLVTGGTGFVGSHSVRALLEAGHEVRLLVRDERRAAPALEPLGVPASRVTLSRGDVTDAASVREAVRGCQGVLHAASVFAWGGRRREEMLRTNARGTRHVLDAAVAEGCNPILHVSSLVALVGGPNRGRVVTADSPHGKPVGPYFRSKQESDTIARALQARGHPVVITYPSGVFGPHDPNLGESSRLLLDMISGRTPVTARGALHFVDVRDLAELHARAMRPHAQPRRYPAFGHRMRHTDIHAFVCREAGVRRLNIPLPSALVRASIPMFRLLEALHLPTLATSDASFVAANDVRADDSVSERELGMRFRPLEDSLREMVAWLGATGRIPTAARQRT